MSNDIGIGSLSGRRAVVTGGASGIGAAAVVRLRSLGADVVLTDIDEAGGARVAEDSGATFAMLDVADPEAWDRVVSLFGPFDIAFLNAGVSTNRGLPLDHDDRLPIAALTDAAYRRIMSVNVDGVVFGTRAVLPAMIERGEGDIVVTASVAGLVPIGADPVYGLTKHAVVGFVRSVAAGFTDSGVADVCISAVCPGFVDTNILSDATRELIADRGLELMSPERIADVVALAIDERAQGAQWVVWPGLEPHRYEWRAVFD